jgi:hypothetical protein
LEQGDYGMGLLVGDGDLVLGYARTADCINELGGSCINISSVRDHNALDHIHSYSINNNADQTELLRFQTLLETLQNC